MAKAKAKTGAEQAVVTTATREESLLDQVIKEPISERAARMPRYALNISRHGALIQMVNMNRCGNSQSRGFYYTLQLFAGSLDRNGFVVDSAIVDVIHTNWADDAFWVASCEQLAGGLVRFIANKFRNIDRIVVTVENDRGNVTLEWARGEELPVGPRRATTKEVDAHYREASVLSGCGFGGR